MTQEKFKHILVLCDLNFLVFPKVLWGNHAAFPHFYPTHYYALMKSLNTLDVFLAMDFASQGAEISWTFSDLCLWVVGPLINRC